MAFDPTLAAIRFGYGRHPGKPDPASAQALLDPLTAPDRAARQHPIPGTLDMMEVFGRIQKINRINRKEGRTEERLQEIRTIRQEVREISADMLRASVARVLDTDDPFRERLVRFWADHFTVKGKNGLTMHAVPAYVEDAVRPHITGRFVDLLKACVKHPMMLLYLDQQTSAGPNSAIVRRNPKRGLNENLAREVLELHTLGVDADYSQQDVRELAKLFAGMTATGNTPFKFNRNVAEPGRKTVLGKRYGQRGQAKLAHIEEVLEDLAAHPATADHLARKLAVHFVSDSPDPALVNALASRYRDTGGQLLALYEVLVTHPAALEGPLHKAKQPFDFITSSFRALGAPGQNVIDLDNKLLVRGIVRPLAAMGQPFNQPIGPDGWPEDAAHWITPQGLAARITWVMAVTDRIQDRLPDPRDFVSQALGHLASERLHFAAKAAETRAEGIGIILASPEFQQR